MFRRIFDYLSRKMEQLYESEKPKTKDRKDLFVGTELNIELCRAMIKPFGAGLRFRTFPVIGNIP